MKKFFLPLLLLLSVLGLNQSAEKLRSLTQSNTGWEDYRAAGRLLYQSFGNLFSMTHNHQQTDRGPDPAAGFRIFMEVVERFSKLNLQF